MLVDNEIGLGGMGVVRMVDATENATEHHSGSRTSGCGNDDARSLQRQPSLRMNALYNAVKTISAILFPLITFPYATRVLGAAGIGAVNFSQSVVSYFSLLASLGVGTYAIRECARVRGNREALGETASQIFTINVATTAAAYLALAVTLLAWRELDAHRAIIVVQAAGIVAATLGADWLNSAMEDFRWITLRTLAFQVVSLVMLFALVRGPGDTLAYAVVGLVSSAGSSVANIWYRRRYCDVRLVRETEWRRHLPPILTLFAMILAQTVFNSADTTMIGLFRGDAEVGIYTTATKVSRLVMQLVASLLWVIMPRMSHLFAGDDREGARALFGRLLGTNAAIGLPLAAGLLMCADDVVAIVAGPGFEASAAVLRVLMLGFVCSLFGGSLLGNCVMLPSGRERVFMVVCVVASVVNVVANLPLIPRYGAVAAAWTTSGCELLMLVLLAPFVDYWLWPEGIARKVIVPALGCVAIAASCLVCFGIDVLWLRFPACVALSVATYAAVLLIGRNEFALGAVELALGRLTAMRGKHEDEGESM